MSILFLSFDGIFSHLSHRCGELTSFLAFYSPDKLSALLTKQSLIYPRYHGLTQQLVQPMASI
ncbi:MAG: hypothetical protein R3309_16000, partial [Reinekea sp.]|nr:hypothetical protein [Reinekea sp.]